MSIRVLGTAPGGAVYCYQRTLEQGEMFFVARLRQTSTAWLLYNHLTDSVTTVPRDDTNEDHRSIQALIDAGTVTPVIVADDAPLDPLVAGKEDADAEGVTTPTAARKSITLPVPQDTPGRKALIASLRSGHKDRRPTGARFQKWTSPTTVEIHEDDGTGTTRPIETWGVDAEGRLTKR